MKHQDNGRSLLSKLLGWFIAGIGASLANALFTWYKPYIDAFSSTLAIFIRAHIAEAVFQFIFVITILGIAAFLFFLRSTKRRVYAVLEIVFGIAASVYAANQIYTAATQDGAARAVFATLAGVYIIIRGIDNWSYQPTKRV
jgi:hypothetical protein